MFIEFLFEIIHERCEPLVLAFELAKCCCKFNQYFQLRDQENVRVLFELEQYKESKEKREFKESVVQMERSDKTVKKPT